MTRVIKHGRGYEGPGEPPRDMIVDCPHCKARLQTDRATIFQRGIVRTPLLGGIVLTREGWLFGCPDCEGLVHITDKDAERHKAEQWESLSML